MSTIQAAVMLEPGKIEVREFTRPETGRDELLLKAALWMFTRTLAQEVQADQISVNELIPGPVETSLSGLRDKTDSVFSITGEWIKDPEDVVPLALFLATQPSIGPTAQSFSLMRRDG
jgi:3-oxoacyl-[acyl-carrier protein] reductase